MIVYMTKNGYIYWFLSAVVEMELKLTKIYGSDVFFYIMPI